MNRALILLISIILSFNGFAQINWVNLGDNSISETGTSVIESPDGKIFFLGVSDTAGIPSKDITVLRIDQSGNVIWQRYYGTNGDDFANRICYLNGYLYVGGFSNINGEIDVFTIKINPDNGHQLWLKQFGQQGFSEQVHDIQPTADGFLSMTGTAKDPNLSYSNLYVIKLDTNGNKSWDYYDNDTLPVVGNAVRSLSNGDLALAYDRQGTNGYDLGCTRLSKSGQFMWRTIVSSGHNRGSKNLIINSAGQIVISGEGGTNRSLYFDISVTAIDTTGNVLNDWFYNGSLKNDAAFSIDQLPDMNYLLTGYTINDNTNATEMLLMTVDTNGAIINKTSYCPSTSCIGYDIKVSPNNRFIAAGTDLGSNKNLLFVSGLFTDLKLLEIKPDAVSLFPNPCGINKPITLNGLPEKAKLLLYNSAGLFISEYNRDEEISISQSGFYSLQIISERGVSNKKIVIE